MITLTYLSTATAPFDDQALRQLLEVSRRNNHAAGLTGMLLHVGGHFIQTLEGDEAAINSTFSRIAEDPRHRDVFVTLRESTESRVFADWSMGFEQLTADEASVVPGLTDFLARPGDQESAAHLGNAGIFHRIFRDQMSGRSSRRRLDEPLP